MKPNAPSAPLPAGSLYVDPIAFASGIRLTPANHAGLVAGFSCTPPGQTATPYEQDVTDWLAGTTPGTVLDALAMDAELEVRLFYESGQLLGYAAIGADHWRVGKGYVPVMLLHYYGVHWSFIGKGFGKRLLGGVVEEVVSRGTHEVLALFVDPANTAAISLYRKFQFDDIGTQNEGGRSWLMMTCPIGRGSLLHDYAVRRMNGDF